jgi:hypothetical protein
MEAREPPCDVAQLRLGEAAEQPEDVGRREITSKLASGRGNDSPTSHQTVSMPSSAASLSASLSMSAPTTSLPST